VSTAYALTSLAVSGSAIAALAVNVVSPSRTSGLLGFLAGGAALVTGTLALGGTDHEGIRKVAVANGAIGVASIAIAFRGILAPRKPSAPPITGKLDRISVAPAISLLGKPRLGFALSAQF
jgi:hypothetical protein